LTESFAAGRFASPSPLLSSSFIRVCISSSVSFRQLTG
jgi:hypothetical protein